LSLLQDRRKMGDMRIEKVEGTMQMWKGSKKKKGAYDKGR
jgi:hypothetical protein